MRRVSQILTKQTTSPESDYAVSLKLVKQQRRGPTGPAMDALFSLWILSATEYFQEQTGRQCVITPYEWRLDCFPPCDRYLELPRPPLQAVAAVEYLADDGSWTVFDSANYSVIAPIGAHAAPGRIVLHDDASWPTTIAQALSVRIQFTCGYETVPSLIQSCLLLLVGHMHRNGEEVVSGSDAANLAQLPLGAATIIRAFRDSALMVQAPWEVPWRV